MFTTNHNLHYLIITAFLLLSCSVQYGNALDVDVDLIGDGNVTTPAGYVNGNVTIRDNVTVDSFYVAWDGTTYYPNCDGGSCGPGNPNCDCREFGPITQANSSLLILNGSCWNFSGF